ncbi:MAG: hypothetical protein SV062_08600 [Thermodesulfobacteriota bacterium]|nr:hypothetical protein [Thermodesulfobacteriota bacterium]
MIQEAVGSIGEKVKKFSHPELLHTGMGLIKARNFKSCPQCKQRNYQSMLNDALRKHIKHQDQPLEEVLRRVVREELRASQ